ncbi:WYL domain-containing transcriptional regulator [Kribbella turkmenica]|uniref:WYL domain-containing transcriptional regulator n=1 Tax=Kribbella turkmenica TaxID=2530375 RepID=A0A4R4WTE6_9ACTN|nr:WYL domain-containing protein [Kribbella turkmenica]TDD20872.1 WYL domain-containing transcriptional regulator [Kribbella turkmenica]
MSETSARLLSLLSLLQARRDWPGALLAERLEVSPRTVRRDVDRLRDLGYPVRATKGPDGGYRLDAGADLPPLLFDDDQAIAVAVALQTATTTVTGIEEGALRALATVRQVMPARLRQRVDALQVTTVDRYADTRRTKVDSNQLIAIGMAVRAREVLRFDYASPGASEEEWTPPRKVEPHHLVTWGGRWYLVGWDLDRKDWRTFRVDRMTPKTPTGPRFTPRGLPAPDVATYISSKFKGQAQSPCRGEAILQAKASDIVQWAGRHAIVEEITPTSCRLILSAWSWTGLAATFGMFECDLEFVGPQELKDAATHLAARYHVAAS